MTRDDDPTGAERRRRFEAEALPHAASVRAFATRLERDSDAALDLVQETWLRAFRGFDGYVTGTHARAWLFRILYRVFLNRQRVRWREVAASDELEEAGPAAVIGAVAWDSWTGGQSPPPAPSSQVISALDSIPEPFRAALLLVDVNEQSYEEAAAILEVPVGTVRSRLSRGRRLMLAALVARGVGPRRGEGTS